MRKVGHVEITNSGLALRCAVCGKSLVWQKHIGLTRWAEMKKEFLERHKECGSR